MAITRSCFAPVFLLLAFAAAAPAQDQPRDAWRNWSRYGGGPDAIKYSGLTQINRDNVNKLEVAWTFDTHDAYQGSELQCNPLVIDGVLYATTPKLRLIALDAATGKLRWTFDPNNGSQVLEKRRNRGLSYWAQGSDRRIFLTVRQYIYAVDAGTGKLISSFGEQGRVDLRENLGRDPRQMSVSMTSPGTVYKDLLIVGSIVSESLPSSPGDIRAYDTRTGKLRWTFHTIPRPGEFGYDTWPKEAWKHTGGVNNWAGMSLDEKRGVIFVPTGSAAFDFYGADRLGDDLFANSLIALNADTGERLWHYQTVHHDIWDRDLPAQPALVQLKRDGRTIDAVAQITKSGFVFVFDRMTGKPLFPIESRGYPASDTDGERAAAVQPLPVKPPPFATRLALTESDLTERTPEAHQAVLERLRKLRSAGQFVPPSRQGTIVFPGFDGGGEWGGPAFDPQTGLLYVNANEMAWVLRLVDKPASHGVTSGEKLYMQECAGCHRPDRKGTPPEFPSLVNIDQRYSESQIRSIIRQGAGRMPGFARLQSAGIQAVASYIITGADHQVAVNPASHVELKYGIDGYNKFLDPDGYPAIKPPWGTLTAIDLNKGTIVWRQPFGEYPELAAKGLTNTGSENYGGPVVTAGGLLFIGATSYDKKFHVFDKTTGKLLWETTLPAPGNATPAVYEVNGKEYVVIAAGGGKSKLPSGGTYVAFALPDR